MFSVFLSLLLCFCFAEHGLHDHDHEWRVSAHIYVHSNFAVVFFAGHFYSLSSPEFISGLNTINGCNNNSWQGENRVERIKMKWRAQKRICFHYCAIMPRWDWTLPIFIWTTETSFDSSALLKRISDWYLSSNGWITATVVYLLHWLN